jgi:hypothetical protein
MIRAIVAFASALLASVACAGEDLPNAQTTPGATNPNVTASNIRTTICKSGWTKTIRPTVTYTNDLKVKQIKAFGDTDKNPSDYEEDHLISLELGGDPMSEKNLWPQPYNVECGARIKDVLEKHLNKMVCTGKLQLADAQKQIRTNWIDAYKKYVHSEGCPPLEKDQ